MKTGVIFDLEFCSDEGAIKRYWGSIGEHRELTEIGALRFDVETFEFQERFHTLCKPIYAPLTPYHLDLTGRTEAEFASAPPVPVALREFFRFVRPGENTFFNGIDAIVLAENLALHEIDSWFAGEDGRRFTVSFSKPGLGNEYSDEIELALYGPGVETARILSGGKYFFRIAAQDNGQGSLFLKARDIRSWLIRAGLPMDKLSSGDLAYYLGIDFSGRKHNPVVDSESIGLAASYLIGKTNRPNIFREEMRMPMPIGPLRPLASPFGHPVPIAVAQRYRAHL
jgi:hypothetical protein